MEGFGHFVIMFATGLDILAAIVYLLAGDIPRCIYWLGAGVTTIMTIYV